MDGTRTRRRVSISFWHISMRFYRCRRSGWTRCCTLCGWGCRGRRFAVSLEDSGRRRRNTRQRSSGIRRAMKLPVDTQGFIALDAYRFLPALGSCVCYDRLGDHEKAAMYNQIAGRYRPESPEYLQEFGIFCKSLSEPLRSRWNILLADTSYCIGNHVGRRGRGYGNV